jgi:hypothetical protein
LANLPRLETIIASVRLLKNMLQKVGKKLKRYQRASQSATPKNIFLNTLQNSYGVFIIELNTIIENAEQEIHETKMTKSGLERLFSEPYLKSTSNPSSLNEAENERIHEDAVRILDLNSDASVTTEKSPTLKPFFMRDIRKTHPLYTDASLTPLLSPVDVIRRETMDTMPSTTNDKRVRKRSCSNEETMFCCGM